MNFVEPMNKVTIACDWILHILHFIMKQKLIVFGGCWDSRVEEWCEEKEKLSDAKAIMNYCYTPTLFY